MIDWDDFGTRLRAVRHSAGLSQDEFGDQIGVGGTTISDWERGDTLPSRHSRKRIEEWANGCEQIDDIGRALSDGGIGQSELVFKSHHLLHLVEEEEYEDAYGAAHELTELLEGVLDGE